MSTLATLGEELVREVVRALADKVQVEVLELPEQALTGVEAAGYLQVTRETLYGMAQRGEIPARKVGREWRFSKRALDEWLAGERSC